MSVSCPALSVVIPCFNEEECLDATLEELLPVLYGMENSWEVIVVDDGSRDRSVSIARKWAEKEDRVRLEQHRVNHGSGQAIWTGIQAATGTYVTYVPADGQFDHAELPRYLEKARAGADIVIGARCDRHDYTPYRLLSSRVFLFLCSSLFDQDFEDVNWVHLWRRDLFQSVQPRSRGVFFLEEILVRARDLGYTVAETPSTYRPRAGGVAKGGRPEVILLTLWEMSQLWRERRARR